ncbi:MAG: alpha/beta hydrolase-fold protein [Bacteroidota bacterium]
MRFDEILERAALLPPTERLHMIDSILATLNGFPYIESDTVATFIYRGDAKEVTVASDANGWDAGSDYMIRIPDTDVWFFQDNFEPDARIEYNFIVNGKHPVVDPMASNQFGSVSEVRMPKYSAPWEIEYLTDIPHGTVKDTAISSEVLKETRQVRVYLPPNYFDAQSDSFGLAVFHDGSEFLSIGQARNVLDRLAYERMMEPVIAVFVPPENRREEYIGSQTDDFARFLANELVPQLSSRYKIKAAPKFHAVSGFSNGGNSALWTAQRFPSVYGNAASFSGNLTAATMDAYRDSLAVPLRLYVESGTYTDFLQEALQFSSVVRTKGHSLRFDVAHEGHSWANVRAHLRRALQFFFPPGN